VINPEAIDGGQPETQALRPLAKLNLLVHPGFKWSVHPTDYECFAGGEYIEAHILARSAAVSSFGIMQYFC
jgi:hypothetical protein